MRVFCVIGTYFDLMMLPSTDAIPSLDPVFPLTKLTFFITIRLPGFLCCGLIVLASSIALLYESKVLLISYCDVGSVLYIKSIFLICYRP